MTFARLLSEALAADGLPSTGDVLAVGLPLLRQLEGLHHDGLVSRLRGVEALTYDGHSLRLEQGASQPARRHDATIRRLNPEHQRGGVEIAARYDLDLGHGAGSGRIATSLDVAERDADPPDRPMFVVGYQAWEQLHGHHDELTDIHIAGLVLTSYACGLDLELPAAVHQLALGHRHLLGLNPGLHPVVAGVLTEMLQIDRHRRPTDLATVIARLEHHRELPADLDLTDAYRAATGWQRAVLATLRDRVFDVSRRNRALYFRPTAATVSLTEASVPLMLDVARIQPDDVLTWTGTGADAFRTGKPVDLERWCRFEEAPHLAPSLDTLISNERALRAEHGQGRLQLIIAFLRWVDPETGETVNSPLLTMPAELTRKKGVRDRYRVQVDGDADVNPVLRHVFRRRFGVSLPERTATDHDTIRELVARLESEVRATDPSVRIELVDTPRINLIRRRAQLRVDAYWRRRAQAAISSGRWRRQDHSYDHDDWRPLGLALYRRFVLPRELPLRSLSGASPRPPEPLAFAAPAAPAVPGTGAAREESTYAIATGDVNRHRWEVDLCAVTLASLGSRRTNLSRDYDTVLNGATVNGADGPDGAAASMAAFEAIFTPEPRPAHATPVDRIDVDLPLVLPADDAQAQAIRRCLREESIIIQGPPGTGKSQTITNLIAAMVAADKRVLFVCEKRAALDVVAHRLRQAGLGEMVATIHDSQLDRKAFIADLGVTYQRWLEPGVDEREAQRDLALARVRELLDPLDRTFTELTDARGDRVPLADLVERLVELRVRGVDPAGDVPDALEPGVWLAARSSIDRVVAELAAAGRPSRPGMHAPLRVAPRLLRGTDPVVAAREVGTRLAGAVRAFDAAVGGAVRTGEVVASSIPTLRRLLPTLTALRAGGSLAVLDPASGAHHELRAAAGALDEAVAAAAALAVVRDRWAEPLPAADARAALEIARDKESSALKFLSGSWRSVKSLVRSKYRFSLHQVEPTITHVLTELVAWYDATDTVDRRRTELTARYGADEPRRLLDEIDRHHADPVIRACADSAASPPIDIAALSHAVETLDDVLGQVVIAGSVNLVSLAQLAVELERTSPVDERLLLAWAELADAPAPVMDAALDPSATPDEIERTLLQVALDRAGTRADGPFAGERLDDTVDQLLVRYRALLQANAGMVAARARARFLDHVAFAESSMAGRSDEDKAFKRAYSAGRKLIEREFQKTMRFRSIRELAGGESGLVVRDLKPVWLMSPLSVSDTLPLDGDAFDVVVFDEASQIPVEDAVPSLFRAAQVIVVGDRMQLPPTRFFATGTETDDEIGDAMIDEMVDAEGQRITITLDADSFLTQADLSLPSSLLGWHYRSRSESLIAYSNHAFYGARLATVPDREFDDRPRPDIVVEGPEDARANLDALHDRPISFHRIVNGVYEQRRNEPEADYVAELVRAVLVSNAGDDPGRDRFTIGVVAFSEAQQGAIEASLAELAVVDPAFAELLEEEQVRTVDGEFVGMFVKNLENVQGDERDLIIMSVCYAPQADGKMRMNFGPINQSGGERRLNVIFSRAKQHMAIVSTIDAAAITNTHNDGAAHLAGFLAYAAAESAGSGGGSSVLRSLLAADARAAAATSRSAIGNEVATALRSRGWVVDADVGRSGFTIDVAVRGPGGYQLGIVADPGPADATATARAIAEAGVLRAFGWPIARVLASEWWFAPQTVIDRIERRLDHG